MPRLGLRWNRDGQPCGTYLNPYSYAGSKVALTPNSERFLVLLTTTGCEEERVV